MVLQGGLAGLEGKEVLCGCGRWVGDDDYNIKCPPYGFCADLRYLIRGEFRVGRVAIEVSGLVQEGVEVDRNIGRPADQAHSSSSFGD